MSKFLLTSRFKRIDPKEFDLNKHTSSGSKGYILKMDFGYPKELHELHNEYPLTSDKIEVKRGMLSNYQLKIADLYNASPFLIKKSMCFIIRTCNFT